MLQLARALLDLRLQMLPVVLGDVARRLELGCHAIECDRQRVELFQAAARHAHIESARQLAGRLEQPLTGMRMLRTVHIEIASRMSSTAAVMTATAARRSASSPGLTVVVVTDPMTGEASAGAGSAGAVGAGVRAAACAAAAG